MERESVVWMFFAEGRVSKKSGGPLERATVGKKILLAEWGYLRMYRISTKSLRIDCSKAGSKVSHIVSIGVHFLNYVSMGFQPDRMCKTFVSLGVQTSK
jgi:hypothetical protein